jgi:hypothetical protein
VFAKLPGWHRQLVRIGQNHQVTRRLAELISARVRRPLDAPTHIISSIPYPVPLDPPRETGLLTRRGVVNQRFREFYFKISGVALPYLGSLLVNVTSTG